MVVKVEICIPLDPRATREKWLALAHETCKRLPNRMWTPILADLIKRQNCAAHGLHKKQQMEL